jgi:hypothetical protein
MQAALFGAGVAFSTTASAQDTDIFAECSALGTISSATSRQLDQHLREIDRMNNVGLMAPAHIKLMEMLDGALNYCELEKRLRALGAKTRLLALPLTEFVPPEKAAEYTIAYPHKIFFTHSPSPRYAIWYELKGEQAAKDRLRTASMPAELNLVNLNRTGILVTANSVHDKYVLQQAWSEPPMGEADYAYAVLKKYKSEGKLSNRHASALMYIMSYYLKATDLTYTINNAAPKGTVQIFSIANDTERLLNQNALTCSCGYIPNSYMIVCDQALLQALDGWFSLMDGRTNMLGAEPGTRAGIFTVIDDAASEFLRYWVIGHELGHLRKRHNLTGATSASLRNMELEADRYAFAAMPGRVQAFGHQIAVQLIKQIARVAKITFEPMPEKVKVLEHEVGHPNLLSRAYNFVDAIQTVDFYIEELRKNYTLSADNGFRIASICDLASHAR